MPRAPPGSTASAPAPAAKGRLGSCGTPVPCAAAAATGSATGAAWACQRPSGGAPCATPTGAVATPT